jgi:hypothetical protein
VDKIEANFGTSKNKLRTETRNFRWEHGNSENELPSLKCQGADLSMATWIDEDREE